VEKVGDEVITNTFNNIQKYTQATKFQKTIFSVLLGLRTDKTELEILKKVFNEIDTDHSGTVSFEEFEAAQDTLKSYNLTGKWDDILKQCDLDGDGSIDFDEFYAAAVNHKKIVTDESLE